MMIDDSKCIIRKGMNVNVGDQLVIDSNVMTIIKKESYTNFDSLLTFNNGNTYFIKNNEDVKIFVNDRRENYL